MERSPPVDRHGTEGALLLMACMAAACWPASLRVVARWIVPRLLNPGPAQLGSAFRTAGNALLECVSVSALRFMLRHRDTMSFATQEPTPPTGTPPLLLLTGFGITGRVGVTSAGRGVCFQKGIVTDSDDNTETEDEHPSRTGRDSVSFGAKEHEGLARRESGRPLFEATAVRLLSTVVLGKTRVSLAGIACQQPPVFPPSHIAECRFFSRLKVPSSSSPWEKRPLLAGR
mmetsp:Transcript_179/g.620  ORF Transcript_179/g.620 Transcript_179/m.620 type:complete len:230 (+) Transcript_179:131-820(+)